MTQKDPVLLLRNLLGPIINLLIIYSLWWSDIYAKSKSIALTIILAKILLITYLLLGLVIYFWNHFGILEHTEEIQIFATETIGCEGRAQYYETAGAVRDMLQNHILQVLCSHKLWKHLVECQQKKSDGRRQKALAATRMSDNIILGQYHTLP